MKKLGIAVLLFVNALFLSAQTTGTYQIKFLEINKENSDYAVAMVDENKLVFTSEGKESTGTSKNYNPRKSLFIGDIDFDGELINVKPVTANINDKLNTTGVAYTSDAKTVYFSRNKYIRKRNKQEKSKYQRLDLYKADVDANGNWKNIEKVPFSTDDSSTGYPTLSADNTKLYFVSDRLPSLGKTDIFVVDILEDGSFSEPRNLGKSINTTGDETTPYITEKNVLYFASNGKEGMGNLDIYAAEIFDNYVSEVHHLEAPINSINDDFAYIIDAESKRGFFTSNRLQGQGNNDLYAFTLDKDEVEEDCRITVEGFVKDKESQELLKNTHLELYDVDGNLIDSFLTLDNGLYTFEVPCNQEYKLSASTDNYVSQEKHLEILDKTTHRSLHANMNLEKINKEVKRTGVSSTGEITKVNAIYFDFDKSDIRSFDMPELDKIVKIMKENLNVRVEAVAHTDSRGSYTYNQKLSERRAQAAVDYIVSKGIDVNRLTAKGEGESKLVNHCLDGIECSDEAHEQNRRTDFVIINDQTTSLNDQPSGTNQGIAIKHENNEPVNEVVEKKIETTDAVQEEEVAINEESDEIPLEEKKDELEPVIANNDKKIIEEIIVEEVEVNEEEQENTIEVADVETEVVNEEEQEEVVAVAKTNTEKFSMKSSYVEEEPEVNPLKDNNIKEFTDEPAVSANTKIEEKSTVQTPQSDNKAENYIIDQKSKVIDKLTKLEDKFERASRFNPDLAGSFNSEKDKVTELKKDLSSKNEVGWIHIVECNNQILSFNKTYLQLMDEVKRKKKSSMPQKISAADTKNTEVEKMKISAVEVVAMKKDAKGKYEETKVASKTDLIKVKFKVLRDESILPGEKNAHVVLQNPEGIVANAKGVFTTEENEKKKFTDHTVIEYNHNEVDIVLFIQRNGYEYEKGDYPVKLFLEGQLVATSNLDLTKGF